ncbi:hypothetical protein LOTGIDRAFT_196202 [Lottia gigantea]|uniref:NADH dehydrogenase [ubiquinone] 1 beta subcomplex subunit 10 n=1 Tax=Lottia gigantea TaxID=225164 RepID=V3ZVK5_LOTGI|nr:hypothetical protein LOTGIDRAFT_196202 [Lottia gigantea]ESO84961.1 hypothetical protein LOTGIDRAFT_196202 [Lottia gigantea]
MPPNIEPTQLKPRERAMQNFKLITEGPIIFFKENIINPLQAHIDRPKYYHRRFQRVPTFDQCYENDYICQFEANEQYHRDRVIDTKIIRILRRRAKECLFYEGPNADHRCKHIQETYEDAATNWFIKYGDLTVHSNVRDAYMKQKHRLIFERRKQEYEAKHGSNTE